jgi:two-component system KDP operon response regulator KdpE
MPNVTVLVPSSVDSVLKQMAAARGSSIESVVHAALSDYLKINYSGVGSAPADYHGPGATIRIGDIELDPARRLVRKTGVTPKEFDLLHCLMVHAGFPIAHGRLLRAVWGVEYGNELEYLRTYIGQLRKKLEDKPAEPKYLLTEPHFGYRIVEVIGSCGL